MVDADITVEWDLDNDGDFDEPEEDVTAYLVDVETTTGRDFPSQLTGKAGPGRLRMTLRNTEGRFSYFNASSPLTQAPFSLKTGRKIRVRTSTASDPDPVLLVSDTFEDGASAAAWTNVTAGPFKVEDGKFLATRDDTTDTSLAVVDAGATSYYAQATVAKVGANVDNLGAAGVQELDVVGLVYRYQDSNDYSLFRLRRITVSEFIFAELVNVVAGVETVIAGGTSAGGIVPRDGMVLGVHVNGSSVTGYIDGHAFISGTAIQADETEVGVYAEWGLRNYRPGFEDFYVWDRFTEPTEGVLWTGYVSDVTPSSNPSRDNTVTVTAEGPLARLAATKFRPSPIHAWNLPAQMVGEALANAGMLTPPGSLRRAPTQLSGAYGYDDVNALDFARTAEDIEMGFLYETPEGWVNLDARTDRDSSYALATFSDNPGPGEFGYDSIEPRDWRGEIVNDVAAGVSPSSPQIADGVLTSGNGAVNITVPSSVQDGDLILVIISSTQGNDEEDWLTPPFWVRNHDSGIKSGGRRLAIYSRIDSGSGAGQLFTFYANNSGSTGVWISQLYVIRNWYRDHTGIQVGDFVNIVDGAEGAGSAPAPMEPSWGFNAPSLFVAARMGTGFLGVPVVIGPTYPLGYLLGVAFLENGPSDALDAALQTAIRTDTVDRETPGPFTGFINLFNVESVVIAIRGRSGYPVGTVPREQEVNDGVVIRREDKASQADHNLVRTHEGPTLFRDEGRALDYCQTVLERHSDDRPIFSLSFPSSASAGLRDQAITRRLSDRIHLVASNRADMGVEGDVHIESINHRITNAGKQWSTTWELSPANEVIRADTAGSTLNQNRNDVVVTFSIATTTGPLWVTTATHPSHFPFTIRIDDEELRVHSITGASSPQTFTVERGVNGTTAASHSLGAAVSLADPVVLA